MSELGVERWLDAVAADAPCGPDLEYDAEFGALLRAAAGRPERQIGDSILSAEPPDWVEVRGLAEALLGRSRDLRIAMLWARAQIQLDGYAGLASALTLLHSLIERYWDAVHPTLDPDDDHDPTMRMNVLRTLVDPAVLKSLLEAPLVRSRALGVIALRDVQIAAGRLPAAGGQSVDGATIEAAFRDAGSVALELVIDSIAASRQALRALDAALTERAEALAPDFSALAGQLAEAHTVTRDMRARLMPDDSAQSGASAGDGRDPAGENGLAAAASAHNATGRVGNRDDVRRALRAICDYYARQEPASPVPLLLQRAERLIDKNFLEIIEDLAPDGMSQVRTIRGPDPSA